MTLSPDAQMITGFKEAVGMMRVGDKMFAFLPWSLGYGAQGAGANIPPNSTFIFDVELIDF